MSEKKARKTKVAVSFCTWGHRGHAEHSGRREDQQARQVEDVQNQPRGFRDGALATERSAKGISSHSKFAETLSGVSIRV